MTPVFVVYDPTDAVANDAPHQRLRDEVSYVLLCYLYKYIVSRQFCMCIVFRVYFEQFQSSLMDISSTI